MVYCVPAYLRLRALTIRSAYNIKTNNRTGERNADGFRALSSVVKARVPNDRDLRDFLSPAQLDLLIESSGGHIRDLLLLVTETLVQADALPVTDTHVRRAISEVRQQFLPLSPPQKAWLGRVHDNHSFELDDDGSWLVPAEMINRHLVLRYPNDEPCFDVHPLIADEVADGYERPGA